VESSRAKSSDDAQDEYSMTPGYKTFTKLVLMSK
jgi:hypothetical protein